MSSKTNYADFLTSLTNPTEREPLPGYENKVPRTPKEFEAYWKQSPEYSALIQDIDSYLIECEKLNTKKIIKNHMLQDNQSTLVQVHRILFHFSCKFDILWPEILFA